MVTNNEQVNEQVDKLREVFGVEVQDERHHVLNEFVRAEAEERERILQVLVGNASPFLGRSSLLDIVGDNKRNLNRDCGYPGWQSEIPESYNELTIELFQHFYEREPIATRVVEIYPKESWRTWPRVFESQDPERPTPFDRSWKKLSQDLRGGSKFKAKKHPVFKYLKQVDIDSGIGTYGVLFMGFNDGRELREPLATGDGLELLFLRSISQRHCEVNRYDNDEASPRFGKPIDYKIDFVVPTQEDGEDKGTGVINVSAIVHYTRVIHVADGDDVFAAPRQRPVFNRIWDLRKLYGGSGEMYWRGALQGVALEIDPELALARLDKKAKFNETKIREQMQLYGEGLQRWLILNGIRSKNLAPQVVDPSPQIDRQIEAICIVGGYPKRKFMGSEVGELASTQDADDWNDKVMARQEEYLTTDLVVMLVDRLIELGILEEPEEYDVVWPDLESQTASEKANVMGQVVTALAKYIRWDISHIISPVDLVVKYMGVSEEEAKLLVKRAKEARKEFDFNNRSLVLPGQNGNGNGRGGRGPLSGGGLPEGQSASVGV